jgi:hypothetical protein
VYELGTGSGNMVFVGLCGWSAGVPAYGMPDAPKKWVYSLAEAAGLRAKGYNRIFAVRGPQGSGAAGDSSIDLTALANKVPSSATKIVVVAHSSGSFVARDFVARLTPAQKAVTIYIDLDGSAGSVQGASKVIRVYSVREGTKEYCHNQRGTNVAGRIGVINTTCKKLSEGGSPNAWCLHEALINKTPTDLVGARVSPVAVNKDYNNCTPQTVVSSYLSVI